VVLVKDDNLPPLKWVMAKVIGVCPVSDGRISSPEAIMKNNTLRHYFLDN